MFKINTLRNRVRLLEEKVDLLEKDNKWLAFTTNNPFKYKEGEAVYTLNGGVYIKCTVLNYEYSRYHHSSLMYYPYREECHSKNYVVRIVENQIPGYIGQQLSFDEKDLLPISAFKAICTKTQENESKGKSKK